MEVRTPSKNGKIGRKVFLPSIDKIWYVYSNKELSLNTIFSREKDIGDLHDKHKAYSLEDICSHAEKNKLRVVRQFNILMFEEIKND